MESLESIIKAFRDNGELNSAKDTTKPRQRPTTEQIDSAPNSSAWHKMGMHFSRRKYYLLHFFGIL